MNQTRSRVTVVIPTYNRAHWLGESIASVLAQTYEDLVLVVADNASDDATPDVVASFAHDRRLRSVRRDENVGLLRNHNLALAEVDTEYVLIIPDDDRLAPDALEVMVPVLDAHPSAGMVHARFDMIDADGGVLEVDTDWTYGLDADIVEPGHRFIAETMRYSCRVCASTALMRTAALPEGFFHPDDFPAIDMGMWLRMAHAWDMAFLTRNLGDYRVHGGSHSAAFGEPHGAGYVQEVEIVRRLRAVKQRFLDAHRSELADVEHLERLADVSLRKELVIMARSRTLPERRLGPTVGSLRRAARVEPRLVLDRDAWFLLAGSVLGQRVTDRLTALRRPSRR